MIDPIHKIGRDAHGEQVSAGVYVVGPSGQIVLAHPPVKAGWRLATHDDIDHASAVNVERHAKENAEHGALIAAERERCTKESEAALELAQANARRVSNKRAGVEQTVIVPEDQPAQADTAHQRINSEATV